jgi:hypothetical protein
MPTPITQEIETGDDVVFVEALRPHLLKFNNPAGSLFMEIRDLSDNLLFTSESITIQSIHDAAGDDYFHGPVRFLINASLAANTKYKVLLKASGYTFSELAYIGWCNGFDLAIVPDSYTPISDLDKGLILEMWERKKLSKGF